MRNNRKIGATTAWAAAAVIGIGIAGGAAWAASTNTAAPTKGVAATADAATTPSPSAPSAQDKADRRARLGAHGPLGRWDRVQHGEAVVKTKDGYRTVVFQRGTITAVSGSSLTVRSADGYTGAFPLSADTRVRLDRAKSEIGALKVGQSVGVAAVKQDNKLDTKLVRAFSPGKEPGAGGTQRRGSGQKTPEATPSASPGSFDGGSIVTS